MRKKKFNQLYKKLISFFKLKLKKWKSPIKILHRGARTLNKNCASECRTRPRTYTCSSVAVSENLCSLWPHASEGRQPWAMRLTKHRLALTFRRKGLVTTARQLRTVALAVFYYAAFLYFPHLVVVNGLYYSIWYDNMKKTEVILLAFHFQTIRPVQALIPRVDTSNMWIGWINRRCSAIPNLNTPS
jgi:hypothetical protein